MTDICDLPKADADTVSATFNIAHEYEPTEPTGKLIDPDTGTTETWKHYIGRWRSIEQRVLKALRTRLTRKGIDGVSWNRIMEWADDLVDWGDVYLAQQYPSADRIGCLPCGTPQNRRTYPLTGLNLHDVWKREQPLWWQDEWENAEIKALWADYDELYADAVARGIIVPKD